MFEKHISGFLYEKYNSPRLQYIQIPDESTTGKPVTWKLIATRHSSLFSVSF